jgi:hypothetical protein
MLITLFDRPATAEEAGSLPEGVKLDQARYVVTYDGRCVHPHVTISIRQRTPDANVRAVAAARRALWFQREARTAMEIADALLDEAAAVGGR